MEDVVLGHVASLSGVEATFGLSAARARSTEGKQIRDALAETKAFARTGGPVTVDKERNARRTVVVLKFDGRKPVFAARVSPEDP